MSGLDVLHVSAPTEGGVARCVVDLAVHGRDHGLRVAVAAPRQGRLADELAAAGVEHLPWEAGRSWWRAVRGETAALSALVAAHRPALVHLHASKAALAGRLAVRGRLPTVVQPHAWSFEAVGGAVAVVAGLWERLADRWTTALVCVSRDEAATGRARGITSAPLVVPNGVDPDRFPLAGPDERAEARTALGVPGDAPLAVCVGRLCRQKGQDLLLDAWSAVVSAVPGARLVLVGDGPDRAALDLRAARRDDVCLVGAGDPRPWYAAADVVVAPSRWEGMALVLLEAACTGRPVVATAVAGAEEALGAGAGALVARGDHAALVAEVARRLGDRARADREGARGAEHVRGAHALVDHLDAVLGLHRELLAPGRGGPRPAQRGPGAAAVRAAEGLS